MNYGTDAMHTQLDEAREARLQDSAAPTPKYADKMLQRAFIAAEAVGFLRCHCEVGTFSEVAKLSAQNIIQQWEKTFE